MSRIEEYRRYFLKIEEKMYSRSFDMEIEANTEFLISEAWQSWNAFCRAWIIQRAFGGKSRSGAYILPNLTPSNKERIIYEAKTYARGDKPKKTVSGCERYLEPTWGDPDKLATIVKHIGFADGDLLETVILQESRTIKDLQITRNACAHWSMHALQKVRELQPRYIMETSVRCPSALAWQRSPQLNAPAFYAWMNDLINLGDQLTSIP